MQVLQMDKASASEPDRFFVADDEGGRVPFSPAFFASEEEADAWMAAEERRAAREEELREAAEAAAEQELKLEHQQRVERKLTELREREAKQAAAAAPAVVDLKQLALSKATVHELHGLLERKEKELLASLSREELVAELEKRGEKVG